MKTKYVFLTVVLAFTVITFTTCKKEGEQCTRTKVSGKITDYDSGAPVANATISIIEENTTQTPFSHNAITSCQTNSDGEYSIKFHAQAKDVYVYYIHINKEPEGYNDDVSYELKKRHSNKLNYAVKGKAFLRVHIKNVTPFDENDMITFDYDNTFYGMYVDTTLMFYRLGTGNKELGWLVKKNGIGTNHIEYIFCTSLSTTDYTINY